MSQKANTFEIILGRVEHINASHFNCLSFSKASDIVNGQERLGMIVKCCTYVVSFQKSHHSTKTFKNKYAIRQAAMLPRDL